MGSDVVFRARVENTVIFTMLFNKEHALHCVFCNTLNSEKLSIASCSNDQAHQQAKPEDTVQKRWKMGGR